MDLPRSGAARHFLPLRPAYSIPLGYFGGIGAASRRGILIKGGAVLDNLRDIRVAALDKTGTLTEGVFEVNARAARQKVLLPMIF